MDVCSNESENVVYNRWVPNALKITFCTKLLEHQSRHSLSVLSSLNKSKLNLAVSEDLLEFVQMANEMDSLRVSRSTRFRIQSALYWVTEADNSAQTLRVLQKKFEVFTIRSHLHYEPKFTSSGLKNFSKKVASLHWELNWQHSPSQRPVLLGRP